MPNINVQNIHIGRAEIFIGVAIPNTGAAVVLTTDTFTGGAPSGGTYIGATLGPAQMTYKTATLDVRSEQDTGIVVAVVTQEELSMEFDLGELSYTNLKNVLLEFGDQTTFVSMGGKFAVQTASVLAVSPKRDGVTYVEAMIYQAFFPQDRVIPMSRAGETKIKVVAQGLSQTYRTRGDRLGFVHPGIALNAAT